MPFGAKHQACARHRYPRCNGNRPRSSWTKVLSVHASAASLVSRVGCKVSGCCQSFVGDVSSLYIQAAGHNMLIIITWCFICFLILDTVCVWPVSTTFRHCGPCLLQTALAVMRLIGLANREHAVSSVTGPPHTHPQNMLRKCCHLISNKV